MNEEGKNIVSAKRARLYDAFALLTVIIIALLDQWTKRLVVKKLPLGKTVPFPIFGHNLAFEYTQNSGAAFSVLKGNALLALFIIIAVGIVGYFYSRIWNSGPLSYKLVFAMIIGGALDASICMGVFLLFVLVLFPGTGRKNAAPERNDTAQQTANNAVAQGNDTAQQTANNAVVQENDTIQQSTANQEPTYTVNQKETS